MKRREWGSRRLEDGTIEIELTRGQVATIDARHAELASTLWYAHWDPSGRRFYVERRVYIAGRSHLEYLHRRVLALELGRPLAPGERVDHRNGDGLDNRAVNLRLATRSQNAHNAGKRRDNTSGYKGVSWIKPKKKWLARIKLRGRDRHLGYFATALEAAKAYDEACLYFHGSFARPNGAAR